MVIIKTKLVRIGNSHGFIIPKALIDTKVIDAGREQTIEIRENDNLERWRIAIRNATNDLEKAKLIKAMLKEGNSGEWI